MKYLAEQNKSFVKTQAVEKDTPRPRSRVSSQLVQKELLTTVKPTEMMLYVIAVPLYL